MLSQDAIGDIALTFDDVLILPSASEILPAEAQLSTHIAPDFELGIPLLSAAMDTVTESKQAIAMAQHGGLGVIHRNLTVERQAQEVRRVKKFESAIVRDPVTVPPTQPIKRLLASQHRLGISSMPVLEEGCLVGIVTSRDLRLCDERLRRTGRVADIMTRELVTAPEGTDFAVVQTLMHEHRVEKVLLVDRDDPAQLRGLITSRDLQTAQRYPAASKDSEGHLRVAAAIGVGSDSVQRAQVLVQEGVDALVVDTAHGHASRVVERVRELRAEYPELCLIGGNIATAEAALVLAEAGVNTVKVGIGPGSICTTRVVTGVGVPQITALTMVRQALAGRDIGVIADGGVRHSGDIAKAIAAGADAVMLGNMLAGTAESPGQVELYEGRSYKAYRGMGSAAAMSEHGGDRYFHFSDGHEILRNNSDKSVPEGVEGRVPFRGSVAGVLQQILGGLRACMGYTGSATITALREQSQFIRISNAAWIEGHVHDVSVTREAVNYPGS